MGDRSNEKNTTELQNTGQQPPKPSKPAITNNRGNQTKTAKQLEIEDKERLEHYLFDVQDKMLTPLLTELQKRIDDLEREKRKYKKNILLRHFTSGKERKIIGLRELKTSLENCFNSEKLTYGTIYHLIQKVRKAHPELTKTFYGDRTDTLLEYYFQKVKHTSPAVWAKYVINQRVQELTEEKNKKRRFSQPKVKEQKIEALNELNKNIKYKMNAQSVGDQIDLIYTQKPIITKGIFSRRTSKLIDEMLNIEEDFQEAERKFNSRFPKK